MRILSITRISKTKYKIVTDDDISFVLYRGEAERLGLKEGEEINPDICDKIFKEILPGRAIARCNHLLAASERTSFQIRRSLNGSGYPGTVIDAVLSYLEEHGYINDERYAKRYIEYNRDKRSINMIRLDLRKKGIPQDTIEICLNDEALVGLEEESQTNAIFRQIESKWKSDAAPTYLQEQKLKAFLSRKGYPVSLINRAVRDYFKDYPETDE